MAEKNQVDLNSWHRSSRNKNLSRLALLSSTLALTLFARWWVDSAADAAEDRAQSDKAPSISVGLSNAQADILRDVETGLEFTAIALGGVTGAVSALATYHHSRRDEIVEVMPPGQEIISTEENSALNHPQTRPSN